MQSDIGDGVKQLGQSTNFNGIKATLVSYAKNKILTCQKGCYNKKTCGIKPVANIAQRNSEVVTTEIVIDVLCSNDISIEMNHNNWILIDTNGYSHNSFCICDQLNPSKLEILRYDIAIIQNAVTRIYLYFPELEVDSDISAIAFRSGDRNRKIFGKIEVSPLNDSVASEIEELSSSITIDSFSLENIRFHMYELERMLLAVSSGLHVEIERKKMDRQIQEKLLSIRQMLIGKPKTTYNFVENWISEKLETANSKLASIKAAEQSQQKWHEKIELIKSMEPRDFEIWSCDLFKSMGYNVELTPYSNDKGVDVICEKDGKKVVVQCKRFKGVVSSPEIQKFIGAIRNANADIGYFLTTGTFSASAEKAALNENIILCDAVGLRDLYDVAIGGGQ